MRAAPRLCLPFKISSSPLNPKPPRVLLSLSVVPLSWCCHYLGFSLLVLARSPLSVAPLTSPIESIIKLLSLGRCSLSQVLSLSL